MVWPQLFPDARERLASGEAWPWLVRTRCPRLPRLVFPPAHTGDRKLLVVVLVVRDIIRDKPPQMALVRRNHVVQQLTSTTSNPPFGRAILPGAAECCLQRFNTHASNCRRHLESVFRIVVQDEVIRIGNIRECFAQLLRDPDASRVRNDVEVQDPPALVRNDEKAVEDGNRR